MNLDMHFHSTNSDGKNTIDELVLKAKELWLTHAFLTDHDKLSYEFLQKTNLVWIKSTLSTEISAFNQEKDFSLHLTYYTTQIKTKLKDILENTVQNKILLIKRQIDFLQENGFDASLNEFYKFCKSHNRDKNALNKFDISCYLLTKPKNRKIFKSILKTNTLDADIVYLNFFKKWWEYFSKFWVLIPEYEPEVKKVWEIAKDENWILVMAHPNVTFKNDTQKFLENLDYYLDSWVNWIEINAKATQNWVDLILDISKKNNLFITFWSDNHCIWKTDKKHWDFWEINCLLDKKIVQEKFDDFAKKLNI